METTIVLNLYYFMYAIENGLKTDHYLAFSFLNILLFIVLVVLFIGCFQYSPAFTLEFILGYACSLVDRLKRSTLLTFYLPAAFL